MLKKDKAEVLDKLGFEIMPQLAGMAMEERISYAERFLNIEFLPESVGYIDINGNLEGQQPYTIEHKCGHCGREVAGVVVAKHKEMRAQWLACPSCYSGSVSNGSRISPVPLLGEEVRGLKEPIRAAYEEARKSFSSASYTACEFVCRKILMNVAVDKKAKEGEGFKQYVEYLTAHGHITVPMKSWAEHIKDHGNEATHKINPPDPKRAERTLQFTTLLLRNVYETDELMNVGSKGTASTPAVSGTVSCSGSVSG